MGVKESSASEVILIVILLIMAIIVCFKVFGGAMFEFFFGAGAVLDYSHSYLCFRR